MALLSAGPKTLLSLSDVSVNVKDTGATGDGTTDDAAAIQAAIDSLTYGTVVFSPGTYYLPTGITGKSNVNFKGDGTYGSVILKGASGHPIISFTTSAASVEFVNIEGLTFAGAGAYAIKGTSLAKYLSTFQIRNNHFDAELAECIYGNLILSDIENNDFGYYGTPGAAHRHIYSKGDLSGLASNINRVTNNRFYHAAGDESIRFENGYMVYFKGNNIERNESTVAVNIKGMYGAIFRDNWFEWNSGSYQIVFADDTGAINGNYIIEFDGNWFDLSGSGNSSVVNLTGAAAWADFINNSGVINNDQHISAYAAGNFDDVGLRTSIGWKIIAHSGGTALTAPVFTRSRGVITGTSIQTTDAALTNYVAGKFGVGATSPGLKVEILAAHNDGIRLRNDSVSGDPISAQILTDGSDYGSVLVYDATANPGVLNMEMNGAGYIEGNAVSAPVAPTAGHAKLYFDTSGGKVRLMVIFPTGGAQQVAIEP
jgi:hypothetical protein